MYMIREDHTEIAPMYVKSGWLQKCIVYGILTGLWVYGCTDASGNESQDQQLPGFFSTIYQEEPLSAVLMFNLDTVIQHKEEEEEVEGMFELKLANVLTLPVEVRSRGVTRKNYCAFPPLRIQLKKDLLPQFGWGEYRNYKLVTHCSDSLRDEQLLLREYLVYQLYQQLTDISLHTQLVDMRYVTGPGDTLRRYAFLIENEDEMNARLGLRPVDPKTTEIRSIQFDHYKRFAMFQYMVGNTDWNLSSGHNTQYVVEPDSQTPIVIPYDFDYCGLVNASYARPYPSLPIRNVRERYFMYRGKKDDDFSEVIADFQRLKDAWYQKVMSFTLLTDASKADIIAFLDDFYRIIGSPDWKEQLFPT